MAALSLRWIAVWLIGFVVLIVGTFLPWVYSGRVGKSSYSITGSLERHLNLPSWGEAMVSGWPFIGPLFAVLIAVYALGLRRSAAAASAVVLLLIVLLCGALLVLRGNASGPLSVAALGPVATLTGALIAGVAAVALTLRRAPMPR